MMTQRCSSRAVVDCMHGATTSILDQRCGHMAAEPVNSRVLHDQRWGHTSSSQGAPKDTPLSI